MGFYWSVCNSVAETGKGIQIMQELLEAKQNIWWDTKRVNGGCVRVGGKNALSGTKFKQHRPPRLSTQQSWDSAGSRALGDLSQGLADRQIGTVIPKITMSLVIAALIYYKSTGSLSLCFVGNSLFISHSPYFSEQPYHRRGIKFVIAPATLYDWEEMGLRRVGTRSISRAAQWPGINPFVECQVCASFNAANFDKSRLNASLHFSANCLLILVSVWGVDVGRGNFKSEKGWKDQNPSFVMYTNSWQKRLTEESLLYMLEKHITANMD